MKFVVDWSTVLGEDFDVSDFFTLEAENEDEARKIAKNKIPYHSVIERIQPIED